MNMNNELERIKRKNADDISTEEYFFLREHVGIREALKKVGPRDYVMENISTKLWDNQQSLSKTEKAFYHQKMKDYNHTVSAIALNDLGFIAKKCEQNNRHAYKFLEGLKSGHIQPSVRNFADKEQLSRLIYRTFIFNHSAYKKYFSKGFRIFGWRSAQAKFYDNYLKGHRQLNKLLKIYKKIGKNPRLGYIGFNDLSNAFAHTYQHTSNEAFFIAEPVLCKILEDLRLHPFENFFPEHVADLLKTVKTYRTTRNMSQHGNCHAKKRLSERLNEQGDALHYAWARLTALNINQLTNKIERFELLTNLCNMLPRKIYGMLCKFIGFNAKKGPTKNRTITSSSKIRNQLTAKAPKQVPTPLIPAMPSVNQLLLCYITASRSHLKKSIKRKSMHGLEKLENTYKNMLITHYPLHTLEKNHEEDVDTVIKATHNNEFLMLLKAKHAIHNQNYNDALNLFSKHANVGWLSLSKDHWLKIVKAAYINSKEEPTEFNKAIQKKFNKQLLMSLQIKQASKHAGDQKHTKVLQILEKYKIFRAKTSMDLTDEIIDTYLNSPKRPSKRAEKNIRKLLNKYTHLKLRAAYCNNHKQHNEVIRLFKKASGWFWQPGSWKTKKIYTFKKIEDDTKFWQARIEHAFINVEKIPPQTYRNRVKLLYGNEYLTLLFAKRCLKRGRPDRALQLFAAASQNNDGDYVYLDHDEQWRSLIKMAKNTLSETSYTTITQQFGSDFKKSLRSSFQHIDSPLSEEPNLNLTPDGRTQETSLENEYVIIDENDPETEQKDPDEAASLSTSETETAKSSAQPTR